MKKVVIIGAGPAGRRGGLELLKKAGQDYDVTVLEESENRSGGKI